MLEALHTSTQPNSAVEAMAPDFVVAILNTRELFKTTPWSARTV
jgi:hypothetical protein